LRSNGRGPASRPDGNAGARWLLVLAIVVALGLIPAMIDLSSLLVRAGPEQQALQRSRRAEVLYRAELSREGLKPASVERRGQWSVRVILPPGWEALSPAERRQVSEAYGNAWVRSSARSGIRPGDRATWLYLANDAGKIVGRWEPGRGVHLEE
jgi:hypothetical protein